MEKGDFVRVREEIFRINKKNKISVDIINVFGQIFKHPDTSNIEPNPIPTDIDLMRMVQVSNFKWFKELYLLNPRLLNFTVPVYDDRLNQTINMTPLYLTINDLFSDSNFKIATFILEQGTLDQMAWDHLIDSMADNIFYEEDLENFGDIMILFIKNGIDPFGTIIDDNGQPVPFGLFVVLQSYVFDPITLRLLDFPEIRENSSIKDLLSESVKDRLKQSALETAFGLFSNRFFDYYQVLEVLEQAYYNGVSTYKTTDLAVMKMAQEFSKKQWNF